MAQISLRNIFGNNRKVQGQTPCANGEEGMCNPCKRQHVWHDVREKWRAGQRGQGHWKSLNDDIWIQRSIWIYIRKKNDKTSGTFNQCGMSVSDIVCMCMYVGRFLYFCVETPCNKFSTLNSPVSSSYFHLHSSGTSTHSNRHTYLERMPVGPF